MKKNIFIWCITALFSVLIFTGCGSKEEKTEIEEVTNEPEQKEVNEDPADNDDDAEESKRSEDGSVDFAELVSTLEEITEGTAKVLYENMDEQIHESDTMTITLNGYTLVELNDFHTNFSIPFDDQTDGGVLIAQYTVENTADDDAYYMTDFYISYPGTNKFHNNYNNLLPEEIQLRTKVSPTTDYLIKGGETITGYYAYPFGPDTLDKILDLSTVTVNVNRPHSEKGDINSNFGKESQFVLALSEEGMEKAEANKAFYEDKVTYDNMGEKKMLKEKYDINESEELGDATITLDGYQFTEFIPNEVEAPRFENFKNGIVLLTIKFLIDNNGDKEIALSSNSSKLTVNDGSQYMLGEGMLLNYRYDDLIEGGESGELLQIFVLDQEQYEKIWKDKAFEVEIGPMRDQEAQDLLKGKRASFTLPE